MKGNHVTPEIVMLPPWPGWEGLHPLVVHFPIALLLIVPLLIIVGLLWRKYADGFVRAALLLLLLGTIGAMVAIESGEEAAELAVRSEAVNQTIERHEELAESVRTVFVGLTILFAVIVFLPPLLRPRPRRVAVVVAYGLFLVIYLGGMLTLVKTAHEGGRLVHEFGIQALLPLPETGDAHDEAQGTRLSGGALARSP